jgi:hypothetical protein
LGSIVDACAAASIAPPSFAPVLQKADFVGLIAIVFKNWVFSLNVQCKYIHVAHLGIANHFLNTIAISPTKSAASGVPTTLRQMQPTPRRRKQKLFIHANSKSRRFNGCH